MHPDFLLDALTSKQISEWEAYDRIDPIGEWRNEFNFARIESLILNIANRVYSDPKRGKPELVSPVDFMPNWSGEKKEIPAQSVEEQKKVLTAWAKGLNAGVKKEEKRKRTTPPVIKIKKKK